MDPDAGFLHAVLAEPDEMAHRLVYADWLEDHGDGPARDRAAFIRAQVERATLHPAHPRARRLWANEQALLAVHGPAWAAPAARLVGRWWFHRGFIEEAAFGFGPLPATVDELTRIAPIRRLRLTRAGLHAELAGTGRREWEEYAGSLRRLRGIDLGRESLGEHVLRALASLPPLPALKELSVGHATAGLQPLLGSPLLAGLKTLAVRALSAEALQALVHAPLGRLDALSLCGARLGDRVVPLLAGSPLAGRVRTLSLGHNNLTPAGLRELLAGPLADGLETLDLGFNRDLGAEGARLLAAGRGLTRLRHLNLSRTALGDEGAQALAEGPLLGRLESLDLSLNHLGPGGALALSRARQPTRLLMLDLVYNSAVGPQGRQALVGRFGADVCVFDRER
jgi:uncharacterized protein (TIGR02996 family)